MAESNEDEKEKIESKLSSLREHFDRLKENSTKRMSRLEDSLRMATKYEDQSGKFDKWLSSAEDRKAALGPYTIASQPLKTQLDMLQVT